MDENPTDANEQNELGDDYYYGHGDVPEDKEKANYWYTKAAEQGHVEAQYNLGICYSNGKGVPKDAKKAVYWYTKAAEQGYAAAQLNLGTLFLNGTDVPKNGTKAKYWHSRAAKQGGEAGEAAQRNLGKCDYRDGKLKFFSIAGAILGISTQNFIGVLIGAILGWIIGKIIRKSL